MLETVAVPVSDDDHVTESVRFGRAQVGVGPRGGELLGVRRPRTDAVVGETLMLRRTAGVTVRTAVPGMSPDVAVMVVAPVPTPVARPCDPRRSRRWPCRVSDDDHVTESVRFWPCSGRSRCPWR